MSHALQLSVIVCTHNPRADFLSRTLAALKAQTLPADAWELLVVDNTCIPPLPLALIQQGHADARVVVEPALGLTHARMRGIAEARGDILVWVDDDNLLDSDYLAVAASLGREHPNLGVWGCGHFIPEWEQSPAPELTPYLAYLAVGQRTGDRWSNRPFDYDALPAGAGLCVRATVARRYMENVREDPRRQALGRTGAGLGACEDFDLGLTALDCGLGTGVFPRLRLTHLMPASRVEESYLLRLVEGHARSTVLLMAIRNPELQPPKLDWKSRLRTWRRRRSLSPIERTIHDAQRRGEASAWHALRPH
ncbi:MAG: glycosyltransferase [Rariglobus sp.]